MKKHNVEEIIEQFEAGGRIIEETLLTGEYKRGNREGKKLTKLFKEFEKDIGFAEECINQLYKSKCIYVRTAAAAYSLSLGIEIPKAEDALYEISHDESLGILGFNAEMTLKVWKKQGWLKIYPEQVIEQAE